MRKFFTICIGAVLVLSIVTLTSSSENYNEKEKVVDLNFSSPIIEDKDEFISIDIEGANTVVLSPGNPILPVYKKTYTFPFGTRINDIACKITSEIEQKVLQKKIALAPEPVYPQYNNDLPVDINTKDNDGMTPLMYASYKSDLEIIRLLLNNGADINARRNDGKTALMIMDAQILELLRNGGIIQ